MSKKALVKRDHCQKRPTSMSKETYVYIQRDLYLWQQKPLHPCQKRPMYILKGAYPKRSISMAVETSVHVYIYIYIYIHIQTTLWI